MDAIDDRLKDLIVYINQNSQFDIFAVQLEYYKFESYEIMIPKLFGVEVKKSIASTVAGQRKKWEEDEFLVDAKNKLTEKQYKVVEKLFSFCKENSDNLVMGTGTGKASINPIFNKISGRSFFTLKSTGKIGFKIGWSLSKAKNQDVEKKLELLSQKLEKVGIAISISKHSTYYKIEKWMDKVDGIINIIKELINS